MNTSDLASLLEKVKTWAETEPDISAILLVGSYANGRAKSDSDIDLVILSDGRPRLLTDTAWSARFGQVTRQALEEWGKCTSLRVWYKGGMEVEFGFVAPDWLAEPLDAGTRQVLADGYKVLLDRKGIVPT